MTKNRDAALLAMQSLSITTKPDEKPDYQELYKRIRKAIQHMLDHDFDKLKVLLYRIDVNEDAVREVLAFTKPEDWSDKITGMIIDRQRQKLITRQQYKTGSSD